MPNGAWASDQALPTQDPLINDAREALKKRDRAKLDTLRQQAQRQSHPLAPWVDYWHQGLRLGEASVAEIEEFYRRWPGSYVEDRLRNDWLRELGRRRAWSDIAADMPRFRMNDDREVSCYALLAEHEGGKPGPGLAARAMAAWIAQREADDGCHEMGKRLFEAKVIDSESVWRKLQSSMEASRPKAAKRVAELLGKPVEKSVAELNDNAVRVLDGKRALPSTHTARLAALALVRVSQQNPEDAAKRLESRWKQGMPASWQAWTWAQIGRQSAMSGQADAVRHYRTAWELVDRLDAPPGWSDDVLAWGVRSALKSADAVSWRLIQRAIEAMSPTAQKDPAWQYWLAQSLVHTPRSGLDGLAQREQSKQMLKDIASPLHFYGKLALEELGRPIELPTTPTPPTADERTAAASHPGLSRALRLMALGLRHEGIREWNYSLIGMSDRELLAAAQRACDREIWDRCINTSDRTRSEVNLAQRFPTPFRADVMAKTAEIGLDPAYVYGLIRQESRFITDARSTVGASGLMQVMPATAKWTAKRIGLPFKQEMITDRDANLRIGTSYLKIVLDDFGGSQAMAAAAYNAGPSRPRRWREGSTLEAAAWAETIPFHETRDYVKKVLSNATLYAALLGQSAVSLKARLGPPIGPRERTAPEPDKEIP